MIGVDEEYPPDPYVPNMSSDMLGKMAYIVDLDGTCADHSSTGRGHYEYDRVDEDEPVPDVINVIEALALAGHVIIFVSGREESCSIKTEAWIREHFDFLDQFDLFMRETGDRRWDTLIKREIFDRHIRHHPGIKVVGVFDDRNRVVKMWREQLGLTVFHVADHDF